MDIENLQFSTERLLLLPFQRTDTALFHHINTHPFVRKYLWDAAIISEETVKDILSKNEYLFQEEKLGLWGLKLKSNEETIGYAGFWYFFEEPQAQLLYALLPEFTGKGYAQEASKWLLDYAFSNLHYAYVDAACDAPNLASQKVALGLGMQKLRIEAVDGKPTVFFRKYNLDRNTSL